MFELRALLVLALVLGCSFGRVDGQQSSKQSDPCIVIARQDDGSRALLWAVWEDGTVLCRAKPGNPRDTEVVLQVEQSDVRRLMEQANKDGMDVGRGHSLIAPSQSHYKMHIRTKDHVSRHSWGEDLEVLVQPDLNESTAKFIRGWMRARGGVLGLAPQSVSKLSDKLDQNGAFRGYKTERPWECDWMH
jgi:hypothetical protein